MQNINEFEYLEQMHHVLIIELSCHLFSTQEPYPPPLTDTMTPEQVLPIPQYNKTLTSK